MAIPIRFVDVDRSETWTKYTKGMCDTCVAHCCTMPCEVKMPDLLRLQLVEPFEAENEEPKQIAKRLMKAGVVDHFNFKNSIFTLARGRGGACYFLDDKTRRCTVYEKRPTTCRTHPQIGPNPGYCPYEAKSKR